MIRQPQNFLDISLTEQSLRLIKGNSEVKQYPVSTAKNGPGELMGSECTPRGWHRVRARIGADRPLYSVFNGRRPTGEIYTTELAGKFPHRDWILTRILWLGGLEPGFNRYGRVDTTWRYIYIHGSPDECIDGRADSHGCIRMKNRDIMELFERVDAGLKVYIHE